MQRNYINEIKAGENVFLKGWVFEFRGLAKLKFILLRDMTGMIQCVIKDIGLIGQISNLSLESVVEIKGKVKKADVKAEFARKDIEIEVSDLKILNKAEKLPIQVNEKAVSSELPSRLDNRSLDVRKPRVKAIFKIQSTIINAFREYFYKKDFIEIQPPGIIATSFGMCGSGSGKTSPYVWLNLVAISRVISMCCFWSWPTGTRSGLYRRMSAA